MPLIAKEVIIKVTVQDSPEKNSESADKTGKGSNSGNKDVVAACVEQVMEILKEKAEF